MSSLHNGFQSGSPEFRGDGNTVNEKDIAKVHALAASAVQWATRREELIAQGKEDVDEITQSTGKMLAIEAAGCWVQYSTVVEGMATSITPEFVTGNTEEVENKCFLAFTRKDVTVLIAPSSDGYAQRVHRFAPEGSQTEIHHYLYVPSELEQLEAPSAGLH